VIIQITWNEGRTVEQKKQLYKATADGLAQSPGIRTENVFILSRSKKRTGLSARERRSMLTNGHPMIVPRGIRQQIGEHRRSQQISGAPMTAAQGQAAVDF
jgi:hypothetical protein